MVAAFAGAGLYFFENAVYVALVEPLTGLEHKYSRLLLISAVVLGVGFGTFAAGLRPHRGAKA